MYRFENLIVWQKLVDLCKVIYLETRTFPKEELYGLTAQLRRAVVSIPTNIAEGTGDSSDREFIRFLRYALRSEHEVASLLKVLFELGSLPEDSLGRLLESLKEIGRMLCALIRSMESTSEVRDDSDLDIAEDLRILLTTDD